MKRTTIMGLCLVAALALSALGAASAQSMQHAIHGPIHTDSSSGIQTFSTSQGTVECKASTDIGEITSATSDTEVITFQACETFSKACNSAGQSPGTIVTNLLATELGWISKANNEVGVDFKPQAGTYLMEFECPGSPQITFKIKGSVIAHVTPLNTMGIFAHQLFTGTGVAQEPQSFEGGVKDTLVSEVSSNGGPPTQLDTLLRSADLIENDPQETFDPGSGSNDPDIFPDLSEIGTLQSGRPEYGRCRKPGGKHWKYLDSNCTNRAPVPHPKGKWEWFPVPQ
jgi:hypothetical protein